MSTYAEKFPKILFFKKLLHLKSVYSKKKSDIQKNKLLDLNVITINIYPKIKFTN